MSGFANLSQWTDSFDAGRYHSTVFRKTVSSTATVANDFIDYSYFAGNPPANFYASSPLIASTLPTARGIFVPAVDGQYLKSLMVMSAASSATATTNQNQRLLLADYLLYYPFIDTDNTGGAQDLENTVTLPRYTTGEGVQVMAVSQSAASTVGQFTINYTNSDGTSGRVSQNTFTKAVAGGGALVSSTTNAVGGSQPFIQLQAGDKGVRSIESVTFTAAGGGLMALVLVKPLRHFFSTQECRRTASGNLESFGAATLFQSVLDTPPVELKSGCVLNVIGLGNAGTLASSTLVGNLDSFWRN